MGCGDRGPPLSQVSGLVVGRAAIISWPPGPHSPEPLTVVILSRGYGDSPSGFPTETLSCGPRSLGAAEEQVPTRGL